MDGLKNLSVESWNPFGFLGIDNNLLKINLDTIINTWIVIFLLVIGILCYRLFLHKNKVAHYLMTSFIESFMDLIFQAFDSFIYPYFAFIISLFIFILSCNFIALIPFTEEPTKDLNTTLALGLISFFYKDFQTIKIHGFVNYIKDFLHPFFIMFPLNVIGHFSKVISISFRLFGNIFGGSIITSIYTAALSSYWLWELIGIFSGINLVIIAFFILFEGLIQAFVFAILSLTYLSIALQASQEGELD